MQENGGLMERFQLFVILARPFLRADGCTQILLNDPFNVHCSDPLFTQEHPAFDFYDLIFHGGVTHGNY